MEISMSVLLYLFTAICCCSSKDAGFSCPPLYLWFKGSRYMNGNNAIFSYSLPQILPQISLRSVGKSRSCALTESIGPPFAL